MTPRREFLAFAVVLGLLVAGFLQESLIGGKVLSPADVLFASASFRDVKGADYEPANRLLIDPVLQFQPWLEFNRAMLRRGRLPLWNDAAGCGAPHLANGQSATFDPFHLIAYLGELPDAHARMAAARLWVAGLGMFLLAGSWGLGPWGRWFAGLTFPFCGFLVVWLLFPVTGVAVWTPWLFWTTDRVLDRPCSRRIGALGLVVGCVFLGGHVQTSAHVLLAAGAYVAWRIWTSIRGVAAVRPVAAWAVGLGLGLAIAAVSIVPLWVYLGKSPVWADRDRDRPKPWGLTRPRVLDGIGTAVPYAFGSQRRGHPNLARALGVHNLNESAGGFTGLATLIWLAPQAWRVRRRNPRVVFLSGLAGAGFLGAFGYAPAANLLRAVPVLNVTDPRRLTVWVAFGLVLLGGVGLDHLDVRWPRRVNRVWLSLCVAVAAALCLGAATLPGAEPWLRDRAGRHYRSAAVATAGADPLAYQRRADRQVRQTLRHVPRCLLVTGFEVAGLAGLALLARRGLAPWSLARAGLVALTVVELFAFGSGLNPAIDRRDARPETLLVSHLRAACRGSGRVLGLGEEFLPNVAMRYGLADPRNYDSVELSRSLAWFEPLYEPGAGPLSSRRTVTWSGVSRALGRLREAGVVAVVAASPPPPGLSPRVDRVGPVWVAKLDAEPPSSVGSARGGLTCVIENGSIDAQFTCSREDVLVVRQTYDPGWAAEVDGKPAGVSPHLGTFLAVRVGPGRHRVRLEYDPPEVRAACAASLAAAAVALAALTGLDRPFRRDFPVMGLEGPDPSG